MSQRKSNLLLIIFICLLFITGCNNNESDSIKFKKEFESLNDIYSVNISDNNHFKISSAEEILTMISNNQSFVVLFGSSSDYNTRTIIESLESNASSLGLPKIYYVDIKSIRDEYSIDDNNVISKTKEATSEYNELVKYLNDYLKDYTVLNKDNKEVSAGVKTISMPLLVGIIKSNISKVSDGKDSNEIINEVVIDLSTCDINNYSGC